MVVALLADEHGALPLPWLSEPLTQALRTHRGHALLVHGSSGVGALPYALSLAQAWLCESDAGPRPCGHCGSCRLVRSHLHADLMVLMPETLRRQHEWPLSDDRLDGDEAKRKPSKQIRIGEVRGLIDWSTKTASRGRGKVAVLHPADTLNLQSANALLKTLEEPPAGTRIVLTTADPATLLPTVRSRCQLQVLPTPAPEASLAWLRAQGLARPEVLLAACSGRPLDALALAQDGIDADAWAALPAAVAAGNASRLAGWAVPRALDALQKLCHDAMTLAAGATPRYFPALPAQIAQTATMAGLVTWSDALRRVSTHADHPWNDGLLIEALVRQGAQAMQPREARSARTRFSSPRLDTLLP